MCTPIALGVVGVLGGVAQGIGAYQQQMTNSANARMQANGLTRDIEAEKQASAYEIARTRENLARTQGNARAGFAANGLALDGSAAEVLQDTAVEGNLDIEAIRWSSGVKVGNLSYARDVAKSNAAASKAAAPLAFITPVLGSAARFGGQFG